MKSVIRKFRRAVHRHGVMGLLRVTSEKMMRLAATLRPAVRAEIRDRERRATAFDEQFRVETSGHIHPTELNINHPNQVHAVSYAGSDPELFRNAVKALPIDHRQFVFVDFGSGKGRAILMATEFPFKQVIGVEFAEDLHRIAQDNIRRYQSETDLSKCPPVESVCLDVLEYQLPDDSMVCYFCNPFDADLMTHVVAKIKKSLVEKPRAIFVVYYNPRAGHLFDQAGCFEKTLDVGVVHIWRATTESTPSGYKRNYSC